MVVLGVLLGHGSIFFTPKKTVSGLAFLGQSFLSMFSGAVEFDPCFISHLHCKIEKASVLIIFLYKPTRRVVF